ncbi:unnamed protein product, partial [Symbiodinium necroappetens]
GELLPPARQLLPQDAAELETEACADSSNPSNEAPWQRRVKLRSSPSSGIASQQVAVLHGRASFRGLPRDILSSLPTELSSEWDNGPKGITLRFIARGGDKLAFEAEGMVLKVSNISQQPEVHFSKLLPLLTATTHWQEQVQVQLHQPDGEVFHNHELYLTCQDKVVLAAELLAARGETFSFKFLAYVGCLLTYVASMGISVKDTGASNIGVSVKTASHSHPEAVFFDTLSWTVSKRPSYKWTGWMDCAAKYCPLHSQWLKQAVLGANSNPALAFSKLFSECQAYAERLEAQGALKGGVMTEASLPSL